jgi:peroxiredoxin Q/BCP
MARLEVGKTAPAFTLLDQDAQKVALKDFRGERVVLYFYPADDTPGCTKEACQFNDELTAFTKLGVKVIGLSPDGAVAHVAFRKKYGLRSSLLSDPEKKVMSAYGAYGEKMMYGKKVIGVIRSTFIISPKGKVEATWYGVRADGHAVKVLAALRELD